MNKFYVYDSPADVTTGPYATIEEAYEDANEQLAVYRAYAATDGWGLDVGDLCIYEVPAEFNPKEEELSDFLLRSNNVETDHRYLTDDGEPIDGFDYVCDMVMSKP